MAKWLDIRKETPWLINLDECTDIRVNRAAIRFYIDPNETSIRTKPEDAKDVLALMQRIIQFIISDLNYCKLYK